MAFRDPKLPLPKDGSHCHCGCGYPHLRIHAVLLVHPVTRDTRVIWFRSQEHANNWRRKEGLL